MTNGYDKRKSGNRKPYRILVIVCEGQKTEPIYFNHYRERNSGLKIITPNSKVTDPEGLVRFALSQIPKHDVDPSNGDQVWCVFDADSNTEENFNKAIQLAGDKVNLCLSNPCFEIWYLLHFCYFDRRITTSDLQKKIEEHISQYEKTKDCFNLILSKRDAAIKNAKRLEEKHEAASIALLSLKSNPSTQVFKLVKYILEVIQQNK